MSARASDDVARLYACIRDLVALSSVRSWWIGQPPEEMAQSLRDLLLSMVAADTVHVELRDRATRATHATSDARRDASPQYDGAAHFASYSIGIGGDLGRFTVGSSRVDFPTVLEALLLRVTTNDVAMALQHAELLRRHERAELLLADRMTRQSKVSQLGLRALTGLRIDEIITEALQAVRETLSVDLCEIFEFPDENDVLVLRAAAGWPTDAVAAVRLAARDAEPASLFLTTDSVIVEDMRRDPRFARFTTGALQQATSWASVPLPGSGRPRSLLAAQTIVPRVFTGDDLDFLQTVANLLAASLDRSIAEAERDRLLESSAQAKTDAEQASRIKSEFLGMMSHELRTPLNAIGGYAQLLEEGIRGPVNDAQRADLARIQRSQRYLVGVIDNVLSFLKLGSGRVRYDMSNVVVSEIIDAVEELARPLIDAKHLRYERRCDVNGMSVRADRAKLQQIVLNLLSNAVKFTDSGGTVAMVCDGDAGSVRIRVADTGWGIPSDRLEYVFEPFTQVDSSHPRAAGGTGLGLAISRDFARGMGGELTVTSEPGKGSVFSVALPCGEREITAATH